MYDNDMWEVFDGRLAKDAFFYRFPSGESLADVQLRVDASEEHARGVGARGAEVKGEDVPPEQPLPDNRIEEWHRALNRQRRQPEGVD